MSPLSFSFRGCSIEYVDSALKLELVAYLFLQRKQNIVVIFFHLIISISLENHTDNLKYTHKKW